MSAEQFLHFSQSRLHPNRVAGTSGGVAREFTMRVQSFALALAAVTAAMTATYAQAPSQSAASTPAPMTVTGCLRASPNPSGVPDTTTYTLEPIETTATAPASSTGVPAAKTVTRYTLTSDAAVAFKPHVGHKVEISGHLKDLSAGKPAAKTAGEPASKSAPKPGGAHNTFEVTALKMVAAACP